MLNTTLARLQCPQPKKKSSRCQGALKLVAEQTSPAGGSTPLAAENIFEVRTGHLECQKCRAQYPILGGVAIVVEDVGRYLIEHVKGISQVVQDNEIPREFLHSYLEAKSEIQVEHIEEDLESARVVALYVMNHYLRTSAPGTPPWWAALSGSSSPLIDSLVREHWDNGPFAKIEAWVGELDKGANAVELGCGVGGLYPRLASSLRSYLGVDSSFASVALGRHLALGVPYPGKTRIPEDLLHGPVSREIKIPVPKSWDGSADFIVGDLSVSCLKAGEWDLAIALNAIDMLENPSDLPKLQHALLKKGGIAIQSCPYIWHEMVVRELRAALPREIRDSARAVEWLYQQQGLELKKAIDHVPWLFFKHVRQLEIYSAHLFMAGK